MRTHMRTRKRDYKKISLDFLKNLNFQIFNLNMSRGLTVIGATVGIFSLFMPWILIIDSELSRTIANNSFYPTSGNVGYLIILMLLTIIFLVFGGNYKEKMKLYSDLDVKNYLVILFSAIFMILAGIMCISFSVGLETFGGKEVKYGNGVTLAITSAIFIMIGGYFIRKDFYKNSSEIILEKLNQQRNKEKNKENITLPF